MRRTVIMLCALPMTCVLTAAGRAPAARTRVRPITQAGSVIAVFRDDWRLSSNGQPALIVAAWPDGQVIWSHDPVRGGRPYYGARIDGRRVTGLLARCDHDGYFGDDRLRKTNFGPDSEFTSIVLRSGSKHLEMNSWHELEEAGGYTAVTTAGAEVLGKRRCLDVLRKQPADYLYYRMAWSELRLATQRLIPSGDHPVTGAPVMRRGVLSWGEGASGIR